MVIVQDRVARKVYWLVRGDFAADDILIDRVHRMKNVEILKGYETLEILGENEVTGVRVRDRTDGTEQILDIDGIFVEVGLLPHTDFAMDTLDVNGGGDRHRLPNRDQRPRGLCSRERH